VSQPEPSNPPSASADFFVVAIGGSAGALEAFSELLRHVPSPSALAIVILQHMSPEHESLLVELLGRVTRLGVRWAREGDELRPGEVLVTPPRHGVTVRNGVLQLHSTSARGTSVLIDTFFQSLAEDCRHRAVGVVLSGNGSDGAHGLRAIKAADGITFAQDEKSAGFPSMPQAAIATGAVDRVLPPAEIGGELARLAQYTAAAWRELSAAEEPARPPVDEIAAVFRLLAVRTGVDFADYKQSTIKRRLLRRMVITKTGQLPDYLRLLQRSREEVEALYESMLINVTEFFRDPEVFDFLHDTILPEIVARRSESGAVRIWVPGCSTGEEAYSYAILLREMLEAGGRIVPVQIFGTDVSDHAVAQARAGFYTAAELANVTPERLRRFFYQTERGYIVQKPIRDMCIFARQNVVKDSPFSKLDLVSCRNLMIYLGPTLQRKLMPIFHYALTPGGALVLGNSESVGSYSDLFRLVDRRFRIYARKTSSRRLSLEFSVDHLPTDINTPAKAPQAMADEMREPYDVIREADRVVLSRHGPSGVLVNDELEILQFRGDVSLYLTPLPGRASLNLVKMAREGLSAELQAVVQQARTKQVRVLKSGVSVMQQGEPRIDDLDVTPLDTGHGKERCYLILFLPVTGAEAAAAPADEAPPRGAAAKAKRPAYLAQIEQLTHDLQATRSYLQTTIEKHESTNQELRAANEEIQSSNEELQSTNEELETAKEELQSTNEELTTVNEELHSRQLELLQVNNDLNNLINSVHLPIIILGQDMRIRRFTPMAEKVLNVIPTDVGRPLSDININLEVSDLPQLMAEVVDSLTIKELEVRDTAGRWYSMRIRPYKTAENKIEGVVITLIDIDQMKRTISELEEARNIAQAIIETTPEPLAALNEQLQVRIANDAFYRLFFATREQMQGRPLVDFVREPAEAATLRTTLEAVLPSRSLVTDLKIQVDAPGGGWRDMFINARQIIGANRSYPLILVSLRRPENA
jgi:two-component system CheB/CheR fusion protein